VGIGDLDQGASLRSSGYYVCAPVGIQVGLTSF